MAVTLAEVAARAGVSTATVSRVLNGNYPVAEGTRERVLRAVAELEYVVNGPASALANASSDLVGILVNDLADPFFGIMAAAAQRAIGDPGPSARHGGPGPRKLAVVCGTEGSPEQELDCLTLLRRQRAAAVILTGGTVDSAVHSAALAERLRRMAADGTRVVLCGRPPLPPAGAEGGRDRGVKGPEGPGGTGSGVVTLEFDNRGGAQALTEHLLELGHRRIGYLAGPEGRTTTRHRLEGHLRALHGGRGRPGDLPPPVAHCGYDRASGYQGARELLGAAPGLTAIAAANDAVALGARAALRERGLRVPEDVSVAGFDDLPFSADAALTTVRLPLREVGGWAGRLAVGHQLPPEGGVSTVRAELVVRDTTAPPPSTPPTVVAWADG
ncbi:LacI family transcriptional regulator [Streptomyces sp. AJS327]|uniref:LacI family DNA-binding transcriptional regulator n=1 Tax=Streptomyces sp. AJS327 TaxID=2545265 RepID=UPI0015DE4D8E|nr:LacI family DNA-binding transcriptional regulator [Streptomyces sp. AJS327]MBA0049687.1 LacI family transcriptional regulator [Streptomyces sp. AJS327]